MLELKLTKDATHLLFIVVFICLYGKCNSIYSCSSLSIASKNTSKNRWFYVIFVNYILYKAEVPNQGELRVL